MTRLNRFSCSISNSPGASGNLILGAARIGFTKPSSALDGNVFTMVFVMPSGDWEVRTGCVFSYSGNSLTRGTLEDSSVHVSGVAQAVSLDNTAVATGTLSAAEIDSVIPLGGNLTAIKALVSAADTIPYFTGSGTANLASFTSAARNFLAATNATGQQTVMGLGTAALLAANIVAQTNLNNVFVKSQSVTPVSLTYASTITIDASLSNAFYLTLTGNTILANPINLTNGQVLNIKIKQDGTGSRLISSYGTMFKWPGGTPPTLTTTANARDGITAKYWADEGILDCAYRLNIS